jgi:histidyl-tRNA synthetase
MIVNHRELLNSYIQSLTDIDPQTIITIIDKKMTFMQEYVKQELLGDGNDEVVATDLSLLFRRILNSTGKYRTKLFDQCTDRLKALIEAKDDIAKTIMLLEFGNYGLSSDKAENLYKLTKISGDPKEFLDQIKLIDLPEDCKTAVNDLEILATYLESFGVYNPVIFDASLARGLDYYTGIVFEAFDATGEIVRALCGGGRYDDLVETVGGSPLAGTGFGMGETVLLEMLRRQSAIPNLRKTPDLYLAPIKAETFPKIIKLATDLRPFFRVICNPFAWRVKRHFESADNTQARLVLLLGPKDVERGVVSVRIVESSEQLELEMNDNLISNLKELMKR